MLTSLYVPILSLTLSDQSSPHICPRYLSPYSRTHMLGDPFSLFAPYYYRSLVFPACDSFVIITMDLANSIQGLLIFPPFYPITYWPTVHPRTKYFWDYYVQKRLCVENGMGSVSGIWRRHRTLVNSLLYKRKPGGADYGTTFALFLLKIFFLFFK